MRRTVLGLIAAVVFLFGVGSLSVAAQQAEVPKPAESEPAPEAKSAAGAVMEVKPEVFLLEDAEGRWRSFLDMPYEEFMRAQEILHGRQEPPPRYTLLDLTVQGEVRGKWAELTARVEIQLHESSWVKVPLYLNEGLLQKPVGHEGEAEYRLHFDAADEGYVVWVRGAVDSKQVFTADLLVPVREAAGKWELALRSPAAVRSQLRLQVPLADASVSASEGSEVIGIRAVDPGRTEIHVRGLAGRFQLRWWPQADVGVQPAGPRLEVVGLIGVTVDRGMITSAAQLTVHSRAGPVERFRVRLPEGAEWLAERSSGYEVIPLAGTSGQSRQVVEVRLKKAQSEPVVVKLAARRLLEDSQSDQMLQLAGFDVPGAVRQQGHVSISRPEGQYIVWGPSQAVRPVPVDQLPESLRGEGVVAGFEYRSQPWSLAVRLVDRKTRIEVEPAWLVEVEEGMARLRATFSYQIHGGEVLRFDFDVPDWTIDDVEPEEFVWDYQLVSQSPGSGRVTVSRPEVESAVRQLEIVLRGHRVLEPGDEQLRLGFPRPTLSDSESVVLQVRPGWVAVVAADNVQLTPDMAASAGLQPRPVAPPISLPAGREEALIYRCEDPGAVFVAGRTVHERSVRVEVSSRVMLVPDDPRVEQELVYRVEYQRLDDFRLAVPEGVAGESIQAWLDDQPVQLVDPPAAGQSAGGNGVVVKVVPAAVSGTGTYRLRLRFPLKVAFDRWEPGASLPCNVPLVMPQQGELQANELTVVTRPGIHVVLPESAKRLVEDVSPAGGAEQGWSWQLTGPVAAVPLGLQLIDRSALGVTRVRRAWVQTWVYPQASGGEGFGRRDRAVFCFTSDMKILLVELPDGVRWRESQFRLDGQSVRPVPDADGRLEIALDNSAGRVHCLELIYWLAADRRAAGRWSFQLPRIGDQVRVDRFYWELVLPPGEHLISGPRGLTPEYRWGWTGVFWGRLPVMDEGQLADWVGVERDVPLPAAASRYLFSSAQMVDACDVRTAGRSWIVLVASGAALGVGLGLMYLRFLRHPLVLAVAAAGLLAAVMIYPGPALLAAQAASVGVVLWLVALVLERTVGPRRGWRGWAEPSSSILERGSTQVFQPPPRGNGPSTRTAPGAAPATTSPESVG